MPELSERDDRRHHPVGGTPGRDSLFFNLIMPGEELGVMLYTWTDETGVAGHMVGIWGPGREALALEFVSDVAMGDADFDDWRAGAFEVRNLEPLRTAAVRYRSDQVEVAYDFTAVHAPFNVMFWLARGEPGVNGYVLRDGVALPVVDGRARAEYDDDMVQRRLVATMTDASGSTTALDMDCYGVVGFPATGGNQVFEAACVARIDGLDGSGQYESLRPADYLQRLVKGET